MSDAFAPGTRLGPYEIDSLIGAGGMGQVYRARDPRLGRNVAIKTVIAGATDPGLVRRFETEARAAGALDHPNLLVVYDVGREGSVPYIVSELLDGETLHDRLRNGAIPGRQAIEYTVQIARGLAAAHASGIIHRDLKPENLFLTRDGRAKILDFGVAKLVGAAQSETQTMNTSAGVVVGTAGYMAPEQVRADPVDPRTDIFALGVVMHEMLSGARPFQRDTMPETLAAILKDDAPELPPSVTPAVARIVGRCLEKRPDDRFHSAHDLALALELLSATTHAGTTTAVMRAPAVSRRKVLVYGASSLGLLAAGAAGGLWFGAPRGPVAPPSLRRLTFRRGVIRSARVASDGQDLSGWRALGRRPLPRVYRTPGQLRVEPARKPAPWQRTRGLAIRRNRSHARGARRCRVHLRHAGAGADYGGRPAPDARRREVRRLVARRNAARDHSVR